MKLRFCVFLVSATIGVWHSTTTAFAAERGAPERDPPQWSSEDSTPQARYKTARKEAGAAYKEALAECRQMRGPDRGSCIREAQATLAADLREARNLLTRP